MRIYYDDLAGNIVLGKYGRLFPGGSLEAITRGNKIAIQYIGSEFVELIVRPNQVRTVNNEQAGSDLASVLAYLNAEFAKKPAGGGQSGAAYPPSVIANNSLFYVPENAQVLYSAPIEMQDGAYLEVDGILIEVD